MPRKVPSGCLTGSPSVRPSVGPFGGWGLELKSTRGTASLCPLVMVCIWEDRLTAGAPAGAAVPSARAAPSSEEVRIAQRGTSLPLTLTAMGSGSQNEIPPVLHLCLVLLSLPCLALIYPLLCAGRYV